MPKLSNPKLNIKVASGSPDAEVTASVDVTFSALEEFFLGQVPPEALSYRVTCRVRGADWPDPDNALFTLGNVTVRTSTPNIQFRRVVSRDKLDEDSTSKDEVYARFWCEPRPSDAGLGLTGAKTVDSPEISGSF